MKRIGVTSGRRWLTILFAFACIVSACSRVPASSYHGPRGTQQDQSANICNRVREIKLLPFHGDRGADATYDAFMDAGETALPCLIRKVTDTTLIHDPRETLNSPDTTLGDVAFFLLIDITKFKIQQFLPPNMQEEYKQQGVFAYYKYVEKKKNRAELQKRLYEWYRQRYGIDLKSR